MDDANSFSTTDGVRPRADTSRNALAHRAPCISHVICVAPWRENRSAVACEQSERSPDQIIAGKRCIPGVYLRGGFVEAVSGALPPVEVSSSADARGGRATGSQESTRCDARAVDRPDAAVGEYGKCLRFLRRVPPMVREPLRLPLVVPPEINTIGNEVLRVLGVPAEVGVGGGRGG